MEAHPTGDAPVCVATVLCDQILEDVRSHNKSAIGIFNAVTAKVLPVVHPRMYLLVSVTNIAGTATIQMTLRAPSGKALVDLEGKIEHGEPLATYDLVIELQGIPLEEEGVHFIDVRSGTRHLGGRRFSVIVQP